MPFPAALAMAIALLVTLFGVAILLPPAIAPASSLNLDGAETPIPVGSATPTGSPSQPAGVTSASAATTAKPAASPSKPRTAPVPTSRPTADAGIVAWEDEVTRLVNAERKKASCAALRTDERLRQAARAHSADMVKFNFFSHQGHDGSSFVDRIARTGYPKGSAAAENIAYGYDTPAAVVKGWMGSAGHKANILNCEHKAVGVGLVYRDTTPYWTQDFGRS